MLRGKKRLRLKSAHATSPPRVLIVKGEERMNDPKVFSNPCAICKSREATQV